MNSRQLGEAFIGSSMSADLDRQTQKWLTIDDDFDKEDEVLPVKEAIAGTPPKPEEEAAIEVAKAAEPEVKKPAVDLGDSLEGTHIWGYPAVSYVGSSIGRAQETRDSRCSESEPSRGYLSE